MLRSLSLILMTISEQHVTDLIKQHKYMKAFIYYISSIKNEILKLKNTFALWLSILSALFIPVLYFIYYLLKYDSLLPDEGVNPWDKFLKEQIMSVSSLLAPIFIVLLTSLIIQVEHKSAGLKHLFTLPVPKWAVYYSKLSAVFFMVLSTYVLFFGLMLVSGYLVGLIHTDLELANQSPNFTLPVKLMVRSFMSVLGIMGIQFWLSFRVKNFIIPLGIGLVLVITGLIIYRAEESLYFPYAYNMLSLFALDNDIDAMVWIPKVSIYSMYFYGIASIFGYFSISKMRI